VDHHGQRSLILRENFCHRALVPDVDVVVAITLEFGLETPTTPGRAGFLAKEVAAHVIVDTDYFQSLVGEKPRGLGTNQARRTGYQGNRHPAPSCVCYNSRYLKVSVAAIAKKVPAARLCALSHRSNRDAIVDDMGPQV